MISNEALLVAQLCGYARSTEKVRNILIKKNGLEHKWFHETETSTEGFIAYNNHVVYLIFKSTDGLRDWFTDISAWYKFNKNLNASVHYGFYTAYDSAKADIIDLLFEASLTDKRFVIGGHSLGGGLAVIASVDLEPDYVYTFGAPRALGKQAAKNFKRMEIEGERFAIAGDLFTRLPGPVFYRHVFLLRYFNLKGILTNSSKLQRLKHVFVDFFDEIVSGTLFKWEDHQIGTYIKFIKRQIGAQDGNNST